MRGFSFSQLAASARILTVMTVVLGLAYPLAVTGIAQVLFENRADGSLVYVEGEPVGSSLIAQPFGSTGYFHPRPSAVEFDAAASGASNLGPSNPELVAAISERVDTYRRVNGLTVGVAVPVDAVTTSGSGLDPHISPANARLQAPRVAAERGLDLEMVLGLVDVHTQRRPLGVLGEDVVNVLELNLALDEQTGRP